MAATRPVFRIRIAVRSSIFGRTASSLSIQNAISLILLRHLGKVVGVLKVTERKFLTGHIYTAVYGAIAFENRA